MTTRIPHLLAPYVRIPAEGSLTLLTSVLDATTNWLVLRYLHACLKPSSGGPGFESETADAAEDVGVVLLSFMRDQAFWKDGASRLGLDIQQSARNKRFVFIDGLSDLFSEDGTGSSPSQPTGRRGGERTLKRPSLEHIKTEIELAIQDVAASSTKPVLVIDQIDLLLAATGDGVTGILLQKLLLDLREVQHSLHELPTWADNIQKTHATILALAADEPLIHPQTTTLEREHAALILSLAHEAELVMSLRMLDTGRANDVSGVIRITPGGSHSESDVEEHEYLYLVGGDGAVKVFARGS